MKPNLIILIALFLFSVAGLKAQTTGPAFTPSHLKAAEQYLVATGFNKLFGDNALYMINSTSAKMPEKHRASYVKGMQAFMAKYYTWDVLKDNFSKIYAAEFTEDELKQLTVFYNSPIGKKVSSKTPLLMQKGMAMGQQVVADHRPELEQMMKDAFQADIAAATPKGN